MADSRILIAVDVDGTLINTEFDDYLREPEIEAIRRVRAAGHELALCTGRNALSCASVIDHANGALDGAPLILLNGALIYLNKPRRTLREAGLPREALARLVGFFRESGVLPLIFGGEAQGGQLMHEDLEANPVLDEYLRRRRDKVGAIEVVDDLMAHLPNTALEIGSIAEHDRAAALTARIRKELGDEVWVVNTESLLSHGAYMWIEVYAPQCSKGSAVRLLADELKIPHGSVVAIGDNYNDLDMFTAAGHSVAMGNAPPDVQSAADRVAGHVREHGAARILEEIADGRWPQGSPEGGQDAER